MDQELPDLRALQFFIAVVDAGSFTEAALDLGITQASVSRTIANLERKLGARILRRVPRGAEPTPLGAKLLPEARRMVQLASKMIATVRNERQVLKVGHAWSAVGKYTMPMLRGWKHNVAGTELRLLRYNTPTGGLIEGKVDAAIVRIPVTDSRVTAVPVGLERRYVAFATDDTVWSKRRSLKLAELAQRPVMIDGRTGTTTSKLWTGEAPQLVPTPDVDEWLDGIAAGEGIGITAEATLHYNPRPGVSFRLLGDAPKIAVNLAWWTDDPPEQIDELVKMLRFLYGDKRRTVTASVRSAR